jgi:acyl-CoA thioester hydrolase
MVEHEVSLRVRYAETDQMQFVYYGNYAAYFEVARVELLRKLGLSYKQLEDMGIWMPVMEYHVQYKYPAKYDDVLSIKVAVKEMPSSKMIFEYITQCDDKLINTAYTTLVFVDQSTSRPVRCPQLLKDILKDNWKR